MAKEAINDWLNGSRNYSEGVELYTKHGASAVLKDLFAKSQNSYTERKLAEELEKINISTPAPAIAAKPNPSGRKRDLLNISAFKPKEEHTFKPVDLSTAPKGLQELDALRKAKFQQAAELKSQLDNDVFKTDEERLEAIITIQDNFYGYKGIQEIWKRIDYWKKWGHFIPFGDDATEDSKQMTIDEARKRLMSVRTYESRYKKKPDKQELYNQYHAERLHLEQILMDHGK
jgi:hypothetical protein